jgi:hypothetical protein
VISGNAQRELKSLLASFESDFPPGRIALLVRFVEFNEPALAIVMLSDWIFEEHIPVRTEQEESILRVSAAFAVPAEYHLFIGKTAPYAEWRTPEQIAAHQRLTDTLTRGAQNYFAADLIQKMTGVGPAAAAREVARLAGRDPKKWWQFWKR